MLTDSTRKYLCRIEGIYDQKKCMYFATVLCLIPENVYDRLCKNRQLDARYFTVNYLQSASFKRVTALKKNLFHLGQ